MTSYNGVQKEDTDDDTMHNKSALHGQPRQLFQCSHCLLQFNSEVFLLEHISHDQGCDPDSHKPSLKDSPQSTSAIPDHPTNLLKVFNPLEEDQNLEALTKKLEGDISAQSTNHIDVQKDKHIITKTSTSRETLNTSKDLKAYKKAHHTIISKCPSVTDGQKEVSLDENSDHKSEDESDNVALAQSNMCTNQTFLKLKEDHFYHASLMQPIFPASPVENKRTSNAENTTVEATDRKNLSFEVSEADEEKRFGHLTYTCKHCNHQDSSLKHMSAHYYETHPYVRYNSDYIQDANDRSASFRCLVCPVEFLNEDALKKHHADDHVGFPNIFTLGLHQIDLVYKCFTCAFVTNALDALKEHYKNRHPTEKLLNGLMFLKYILMPCQEDASAVKSLCLFKTEPNVALYKCKSCSFSHKSVIVLQVHYQKNHPEEAVTIDIIKRRGKKTRERPSCELQTITSDHIPILEAKSKLPSQEKEKEGSQIQTKEQVKNIEAKSESSLPEKVNETLEAKMKTKNKVKTPKATSESSVPEKVRKGTRVHTKTKEKLEISQTMSKPFRHKKNETQPDGDKGLDFILEHTHNAAGDKQVPAKRMTSPNFNEMDEEQKPIHKLKPNIYERPQNLYFCFKCNYGNPTIKGVMVHQFRTHDKLRTRSEHIVEYTTEIHNKLQDATPHTEDQSFCPLLPLPILNEGDEHTFFCHFCHYRRSTVSKVVQHYVKKHNGSVATPKEIQAYTFRTLELLQKKEVSNEVQHKKPKNKQQAPQTLQCNSCLYKSHNPNLFRIHIRKCHRENNSSSGVLKVSLKQGDVQSGYQCDLCSFSHKKPTTLYKHYMQEHRDSRSSLDLFTTFLNEGQKISIKKKRKDMSDGKDSDTDGQSDTRIYSCRACSFKGSSVAGILEHYRAVHPWCVKEDGSVPGLGSRKKLSTKKNDDCNHGMLGCFDEYGIPLESPSVSLKQPTSVLTKEEGNKESEHTFDKGEDTHMHVFKCPYCTYVNTKHQGVLTHCQMRHPSFQSEADSLYVDQAQLGDWVTKRKGEEGDASSHFRGYMCEFCPQTHQTREKLRKHREKAHGETPPDAMAVPYARKLHIKVSKSVPYKIKMTLFRCQQCKFSCSNKIAFGRHMRLKHMSTGFQDCRYSCVLCSNSYYKKKRLGVHYKDKHGQEGYQKHFVPLYEQASDRPLEPEGNAVTKRLVYKCPQCPYVNSRKHGMATHCQMMHPGLTVRMEEFDREEIVFSSNYQASTNNKRGYQCDLCLAISVSLKKLAIHRANRHCVTSKKEKETPASEELNAQRPLSEATSVIQANPEGKRPKKVGSTRHCLFKCLLCSYSSVVRNRLAVHYTKRHGKAAFLKHFAPLYPHKIKKEAALPQLVISEQEDNTLAGEEDIFQCQMCEYKTWARRYLTYHYNKTHQLDAGTRDRLLKTYNKRKIPLSQNNPPDSVKIQQGAQQTAPIHCKKCPELSFDTHQLLLAHYCDVHLSDDRSDFTVIYPAGRSTGVYQCTHCHKTLNGISKLGCHLDRHREKTLTKMATKKKLPLFPKVKTSKSLSLETTANGLLGCTALQDDCPLKSYPSLLPHKVGDQQQVDPKSLIECYACDQCQRTFKSRNGLRTHKRSHEALAAIMKLPASLSQLNLNKYLLHKPGTIRPFQCSICFYRTNLMGLFSNHLLKNHLDTVIETCDKKEETSITHSADTNGPHHVPIDGIAKTNEGRTKDWYLEPPEVRRQLNHLSQMTQNGARAIPANKQSQSGRPLHCENCSFFSQDLPSMRRHYISRHGRKMLTCKDCHFFTGLKKIMKVHVNMDHSTLQKEAPSQVGLSCCPFCLYQTKNKNNMIDHVLLHREERVVPVEVRRPKLSRYLRGLVFRCHLCTYTSASADNLRSHVARHQCLNPYRCRLCYFDCARLAQLEAHLCSKHQVMRNYELVGQVCLEQLEQMKLSPTQEDKVDEEEHGSNFEDSEHSVTPGSEINACKAEKSQMENIQNSQVVLKDHVEKPNSEDHVQRNEENRKEVGVDLTESSGKVAVREHKRKLSKPHKEAGLEEDTRDLEGQKKRIKMEETCMRPEGCMPGLKGVDKRFSCDLCGRNLQNQAELQSHSSRHGM
ncbi:zinc finger protein 462-like isoform X1 [Stigmatopora nigra]